MTCFKRCLRCHTSQHVIEGIRAKHITGRTPLSECLQTQPLFFCYCNGFFGNTMHCSVRAGLLEVNPAVVCRPRSLPLSFTAITNVCSLAQGLHRQQLLPGKQLQFIRVIWSRAAERSSPSRPAVCLLTPLRCSSTTNC